MTLSVTILGATGSIGQQSCDVIAQFPDKYRANILTAHSNVSELVRLAKQHQPNIVAIADETHYQPLKQALSRLDIEIMAGTQAIADVATIACDRLITGIGGMAGLKPLINAIKNSNENNPTSIGFANKESLVAGGNLILDLAKQHHARLLPMDSEHQAIHQLMAQYDKNDMSKLLLSASGGPFLSLSKQEMYHQPIKNALAHPKWQMGKKISVDSATMMNKALEIIEACYLFGVDENMIEVVIHPEAIVHSMVTLKNGATLSLMAQNDMRLPISYALDNGNISDLGTHYALDWSQAQQLSFMPLDNGQFPAVNLARQAYRHGNGATIALNAANEVAVAAFLNKYINFGDIIDIIAHILHDKSVIAHYDEKISDIDDVIAINALVHTHTNDYIKKNF